MSTQQTITQPAINPSHVDQASKALPNGAKFNNRVINYVSHQTQSKLANSKFSMRSLLSRFSKTQNCDQSVQPNKTQQAQIDLIIHNIKNFKTENEAEPAKTGGSAESQHPLYTTNHFLRLAFGNSGQKEQSITPEQALGIIDGALRSDIKPETKTALLELLNGVLSNSEVSDETQQQITDYVNHMISDKENGWPEDVCALAVKTFYQAGSQLTTKINAQFKTKDDFAFTGKPEDREATLSLLQDIINSSEEIPEWALNLLVGAANSATKNETAGDVQSTEEKIPAWLSEVMRGIKPEAFQKIAEAIISNKSNGILNQENARLATITTLALAALPEDDNQINENCMPFTALSGLLSIKNEQDDNLNGPNIVAHIGQALIDADCNYKVGEEARWTNSRTTAFLKALNNAGAAQTSDPNKQQEIQNLAKDALCTCRQKLTGNAYKFDVAIQHIADEAGTTTTPKLIISFLADHFVNAGDAIGNESSPYHAIATSMQNFKTDTGETLFQFKPATCTAIKDAMKSLRDGEEPSDDQLQYFSEIQEKRYETLSDDKIVDKMQDILNAAADGTLETELKTHPNLFPSMYVLEHVCTLLDSPDKRAQTLKETKKIIKNDDKIQTALDIILKHYSLGNKTQPEDKSQNQNTKNDNTIRTAFSTFRSSNEGQTLEEINVRKHEALLEATPLQNPESEAATLFTEQRELKGVSGYGNNCLFYAIFGQCKTHNPYKLRQKYVEIQKAGKDISPKDEQRLKEEQADISCLPQMASYLKRPIVVLTEKSDDDQGENGIQIALPGDTAILIPLGSLETTLQDAIDQDTLTNAQNALTEALKAIPGNENLSVNDVKEMTVQKVLEKLLGHDNTIALHFKGHTTNGHYQSFIPKKKVEEVQPVEEVAEQNEEQINEVEEEE